ncbi:MAG: hypothetical protein WCI41_00905 [bacterium]
MKKVLTIGVMGPGKNATESEILLAERVGRIIAKKGHYTLTGGSNTGVMNAALKGAKDFDPDARTIAILSNNGEVEKTSQYADVCIPTGMGEGRNYMNIRSCDIIVFCCDDLFKSTGTLSEFAFAVKHEKCIIIIHKKDGLRTRPIRSKWNYILTSIFGAKKYIANNIGITFDIEDFEKYLDMFIDKIYIENIKI